MQNLGGQIRCIMGDVQVANNKTLPDVIGLNPVQAWFFSSGADQKGSFCLFVLLSIGNTNREKSLRHAGIVAKFLDDKKPKTSLKSPFALFQTSPILFNFIQGDSLVKEPNIDCRWNLVHWCNKSKIW